MGSEERSIQIDIPSYEYPGSWMIGARTYAVDRILPDVERIWLPPRLHDFGGNVRFTLVSRTTPPIRRTSRLKRLKNALNPHQLVECGSPFFDTRHDDYFNFSHQVNFYLTLALAARKWLCENMTVILPASSPQIASDIYSLFGFQPIATDGPVKGIQCHWDVTHWETVPCGRKILTPVDIRIPEHDLPTKVFLSRRNSRSIINEDEVEAILPGFAKVFAEDLSVAEQFALWQSATDVVAIHGAAMAPMQYRRNPGLKLVEISPVGHVTRWFGIMCHQVGGKYIQVRGRMKPDYVKHCYGSGPYFRHSADRFEVDPSSLQVALEMIG